MAHDLHVMDSGARQYGWLVTRVFSTKDGKECQGH